MVSILFNVMLLKTRAPRYHVHILAIHVPNATKSTKDVKAGDTVNGITLHKGDHFLSAGTVYAVGTRSSTKVDITDLKSVTLHPHSALPLPVRQRHSTPSPTKRTHETKDSVASTSYDRDPTSYPMFRADTYCAESNGFLYADTEIYINVYNIWTWASECFDLKGMIDLIDSGTDVSPALWKSYGYSMAMYQSDRVALRSFIEMLVSDPFFTSDARNINVDLFTFTEDRSATYTLTFNDIFLFTDFLITDTGVNNWTNIGLGLHITNNQQLVGWKEDDPRTLQLINLEQAFGPITEENKDDWVKIMDVPFALKLAHSS